MDFLMDVHDFLSFSLFFHDLFIIFQYCSLFPLFVHYIHDFFHYFTIGIVILIVMKHKSSQVEREYKRIQIQMDLLENNVRSECKQAFAELQTDMTK